MKPVTRSAPAVRELGAVLGVALAAAVLVPTWWVESGPVLCPFRLVSGLPCPACGLTRAWVYLGHGQVGSSLAEHPAGALTMLLAIVTLGWLVRTRGATAYPRWLRRSALLTLIVTIGVGLVRLAAGVV